MGDFKVLAVLRMPQTGNAYYTDAQGPHVAFVNLVGVALVQFELQGGRPAHYPFLSPMNFTASGGIPPNVTAAFIPGLNAQADSLSLFEPKLRFQATTDEKGVMIWSDADQVEVFGLGYFAEDSTAVQLSPRSQFVEYSRALLGPHPVKRKRVTVYPPTVYPYEGSYPGGEV